jgi:hypothetical protein
LNGTTCPYHHQKKTITTLMSQYWKMKKATLFTSQHLKMMKKALKRKEKERVSCLCYQIQSEFLAA